MPRDPAGPGPSWPGVRLEPLARRAVRGWMLLGVGGLAVAGILALILAVARTPGAGAWFPWAAQDAFRKVLVSHVVFAFVLWFWAMLGALAVRAKGNGLTGMLGLAAATAGAALMLVTALGGGGTPALSNYIPVLLDPVFLAGLGLYAAGVAVPVGHLLAQPPHRDAQLAPGVQSAGALFILALVCFALAWRGLPAGADPYDHVDTLFWGAGHMLQFAYAALTLTAWQVLGQQAFGAAPLSGYAWRLVCAVLVIAAVPGPVFYMVMGDNAEGIRAAFTGLYTYGMPIPIAAGAIATAIRLWKGPRDWRSPAFLGVTLSLAQFLFGGLLGIFADGADTRTPAHYHAEIGGVNLGLMALTFVLLLPALGRYGQSNRAVQWLLWLYAGGQAAASAGLFVAGWEGVGRKVAGAAQGLDTLAKQGAMGVAGAGGVVAVAGGVLFIWLALARLLARQAR
jgi:hypothetical protein